MKINFISLVNPYRKIVTGGSEDIRRRIAAVAREYDVDVLAVDNISEQTPHRKVPPKINLTIYPRKTILNPAKWLMPIPVFTRYNASLIKELKERLETDEKQVNVIEGLQSCLLWLGIPHRVRAQHYSILRLHNIESNYHKALANTVMDFTRYIHLLTSWQYKWFEAKVFPLFDEIHVISRQEIEVLTDLYPQIANKLRWVPPLVDIKEQKDGRNNMAITDKELPINRQNYKIGYFGDLNIALNVEGLKWFLNSGWLTICKAVKYAELHIAGHNSELFKGYEHVYTHGFVEDLDEFINGLDVLIVPIQNGAGVKIKVIDSIAWGKPLVTTSVGIEGTDDQLQRLVWINDEINDFSNSLLRIHDNYREAWKQAQRAKEWISTCYDAESCINKFAALTL
ncbi:hypothetical protein P22_0535 [Propionispora sp. 2/2-37]|uniref:glycosyltransferase n=1 Tax=Propionispora sp. 2/2-37 TaxID=1677858 RepID=UPI0006BB6B77|nr:glycosyltransferase [Propionispora sp. 2/2-37]CUH94469.1 hypothetical protein P22_0535 [Propionispora sp. 2/2-37]